MSDFLRGDCHKCKFEITAECVPRSQKMGFPNCYQSTMTNADRVRSMSDEELATWIDHLQADAYERGMMETAIVDYPNTYSNWLDWLRKEAK